MRHQRNDDSELGGAGSSPFCFCQLVIYTFGDQKINTTQSLCGLTANKLWQALQHRVHFCSRRKANHVISQKIWGDLKEIELRLKLSIIYNQLKIMNGCM